MYKIRLLSLFFVNTILLEDEKHLITLCIFFSDAFNKKRTLMKQQSKRYCHNRKTTLKADSIVNGAIEAHGKLYDNADYSFVFRGTKYRFQNNEATTYSSEIQKEIR
jgi:hypothetical protein